MENSNTNTTKETIVGQHLRTSQECDGGQISTGRTTCKPDSQGDRSEVDRAAPDVAGYVSHGNL